MVRSALSKVAWVGRTASMVFGLALVLALVLGVATTALSATGANLILGKFNAAEHPTSLVSTLSDAIKPALSVNNKSGGPALRLGVTREQAPIKVNAGAGTATNLSADKLDGKEASELGQMWAVVGPSCAIVRGSGVSGSAPSNFCGVTFERDISNCAFIASISESGAGYPGTDRTGEVWAFTGDGTTNGGSKSAVYVRTANSSGGREGLPFHVAVFC